MLGHKSFTVLRPVHSLVNEMLLIYYYLKYNLPTVFILFINIYFMKMCIKSLLTKYVCLYIYTHISM